MYQYIVVAEKAEHISHAFSSDSYIGQILNKRLSPVVWRCICGDGCFYDKEANTRVMHL